MTDGTQSPTILIVEDEQSLADLFADFLARSYSVLTTSNGTDALDTISDEVDVVLLDRRMPGLSGEEVLEGIREGGYDCCVAMVTAVTPDVDVIEMRFEEYLTKPIDMQVLLDVVERLVELSKYDGLVREYYQLATKKALLEAEKGDYGLAQNEAFDRLTTRLAELEAELDVDEGARAVSEVPSFLRGNNPNRDT